MRKLYMVTAYESSIIAATFSTHIIGCSKTFDGALRLRDIACKYFEECMDYSRVSEATLKNAQHSVEVRISSIDEFDPALHTIMALWDGAPRIFDQCDTAPDLVNDSNLKNYPPE